MSGSLARPGEAGSREGRELRVAVVGAGWMGQAHLRAYAAQPGVRIVALVTRSPARGAELSARFPIERTYASVDEMLDEARPDGISVTTAEHDHVAPACAALERGAGVLVEKPMASRLEDAERIVEAAAGSGSLLVPAHVLRFAAPHQALKREVTEGRLGEVVAISARRDRSRRVAEHYAHVHPSLLTAVHDIDQVLWLTGSRVRRVRALEARRTGGPQPDLVWAHLELENGVVAALASATLHPAGGSVTASDRLEVYGTRGVAAIDLTTPLLAVHASPPAQPDWLLEPSDGGGAFGAEIAHFCGCLRGGHASDVVTPAEAVAGIRVAEAIARSAASGGQVLAP
jgi:predicted dehydrogenase